MRRCSTLLSIAISTLLWVVFLASPLRAAAQSDYDPSTDFTKYHTFRWLGEASGGAQRGPRGRQEAHPALSPLVDKQIRASVVMTLEAKGIHYADQGPADLLIAYHAGRQRDIVGYGWGPRYRGPQRVVVYQQGTLTIDLIDREARDLVWRGAIAATLKEDPEKLHRQLESLVEKIFKKYPPK